MALIDKASLLMVPSTYEDGTLYNILPSGNKAPDETGNHNAYDQTRADFTFSRGSNLAATRVNADGLIEKGRENLLTYSNTFSDSDWGKGSSITLTSGQSGYDGTNNAWLLSKGSVQYPSLGQQVSNSGVKTLSVYAKANATSNLCLFVSSSPSNFYQDFDLSNGTLGAGSNGVIATNIDSVGDGWYRCSVVFNGATTSADIFPDTISGANAGSIYIQNAQLEQGLVATDYIETGSVSATAGVLENTPRIDYSSGAGSLKLEPQRTNLFAHSEYLDNWTGGGAITTNTAISPDGLENASTFTTSSAGEDLRDTTNVTGTYVFSIFAKLVDVGGVRLRIDAATDANAYFDLSDGSVYDSGGIIDADAIDYGNNWWRVYMVANVTNTQKIQVFTTDGTTSYANGSVYLYGAQLEAGSHVSSYVPTYGSAATRGADSCSVTGVSDVIGQTEGTMYAEFDFHAYAGAVDRGLFSVAEAGQGYIDAIYVSSYNNDLYLAVYNGGAVQVNIAKSNISIGKHKIAIAYKANDFAYYLDGVQIGTDSSGSLPTPLNFVGIGNINGGYLGDFDTSEFILFNERLTNEELATLTTL